MMGLHVNNARTDGGKKIKLFKMLLLLTSSVTAVRYSHTATCHLHYKNNAVMTEVKPLKGHFNNSFLVFFMWTNTTGDCKGVFSFLHQEM